MKLANLCTFTHKEIQLIIISDANNKCFFIDFKYQELYMYVKIIISHVYN